MPRGTKASGGTGRAGFRLAGLPTPPGVEGQGWVQGGVTGLRRGPEGGKESRGAAVARGGRSDIPPAGQVVRPQVPAGDSRSHLRPLPRSGVGRMRRVGGGGRGNCWWRARASSSHMPGAGRPPGRDVRGPPPATVQGRGVAGTFVGGGAAAAATESAVGPARAADGRGLRVVHGGGGGYSFSGRRGGGGDWVRRGSRSGSERRRHSCGVWGQ